MRLVPQDVRLRLALAGVIAGWVSLGVPAAVSAQERSASGTSASDIIDPFAAMPRARAAAAALGVMVVEILDPFAAVPARTTTARVVSEIIDPFVASGAAASARSEILDPWSR